MSELNQKEEILNQIKFMIDTSPEEFINIAKDAISLFIKSTLLFGINSNQSKESLNTLKEMFKILKKEKEILYEIANNINYIDLNETSDFIDTLDELNENTYNYYDSILENIDISCEIRNKNRVIKPRESFNSLITDNSYVKKEKELIKKKDDLIK